MKFTLDVKLTATLNVADAAASAGQPFAEVVFAAGGVASIFGVNDFVTVTRQAGADWEPIVAAAMTDLWTADPSRPSAPVIGDVGASAAISDARSRTLAPPVSVQNGSRRGSRVNRGPRSRQHADGTAHLD